MVDRRLLIAALREDFHFFVVWAFHVLNPGALFQDNWHIDAIIHHLMKVLRGDILRLLITMPPRSLKSHTISVALAAWQLGRDPTSKFICASYGEKPSELLAQQMRKLMQHPDYRAAFPRTVFADNSPLDMMKTTEGGYRCSTSVGGAATGIGADFVIADDLTKASASAVERLKATEFYRSSLLSRFNDKKTGRAVVVAQRTALDDLPGYLIEQGGYTHLNLPAIAQTTETIEIGAKRQKLFHAGAYLHETREGRETLERAKRDLGDEHFAAQYLQKPNAAQGAILDPQWFPSYDTPRPHYPFRVMSVDTALSDSTTANYSVASIFGVDEEVYDLIHVWRGKVVYEPLSAKIKSLIDQFAITHVIVERSAAGYGLLKELNDLYCYGVLPFHATMSKEERVHRAIPVFRTKKIRLPKSAPWLSSFKNELFSFPNVIFDDQIDTVVQFADYAPSIPARDPLTIRGSDHDWGEVWVTGERRRHRSW